MSRIVLASLFAFAALAHAADPIIGDPRSETENHLGKPVAVKTNANGEVMAKYPRGTVTYFNNRVVKVEMLSPEAYQKRLDDQKADELAAIARAKAAAAAKAARTETDNRARDAYIASDAYKQLSTAGRIAALNTFAEKHPDAELTVLRADLGLTLNREAAARREQAAEIETRKGLAEKIAALETRLAEQSGRITEADATNARLAARLLKAEADTAALAARLKTLEDAAAAKPAAPTTPLVVKPTATLPRK